MPRYLLGAVSVMGVAASARFAIAPPQPADGPTPIRVAAEPDRAAEAYAVLFARRYLTWNASDPLGATKSLEPFAGGGIEPDAGLALPTSGSEQVSWAEVVQGREPQPGSHVYTVAAQTDSAGLQYLTVGVTRTGSGALALSGYPAFVGAPASAPADPPQHLPPVEDQSLEVVVRRALANYLSGSSNELAADLTTGARVSLPTNPLRLQAMQRPTWVPGGASVLAVLQASDGRGVRYTLSYELDVTRSQGRWEISAVQADPDA